MKKLFFAILSMSVGLLIVHAAPTQSFYTSSKYVESGSSVTATLRLNNVASWSVHINSSGATSGCSSTFADATANGQNTTKYLTVTCRATSTGQIGFTVTGDATSSDGATINVSGSATVTVTPPREKDTNNYLKSIGVTGYELTPEFSKETLEYSVTVPNTVEKVTLTAEAESTYANVTGIGEVEIVEGANSFEIKVMSETGVERIYKIIVNVEDENPIHVTIDNENYTIMKNIKTLETPRMYESTTVTMNELEIPAYYSEISKFTLVGVKDNKGDALFAIYDKTKNTYSLYNENESSQITLYLKPLTEELKGYHKTKMTINNQTQEVYLSDNNDDVVVVYGMNIETGESDYYFYDKENKTFLKYQDNSKVYEEQLENYKMLILVFAGVAILFFFISLILLVRKPKYKKQVKKEVKEEPKIKQIKTTELKKEKKKKNKKEEQKEKESPKEVPKDSQEKPSPKKKKSKEDALEQVSQAAKMIEDYEKTMRLSKKELEAKKEEMKTEETMYDILGDDKKKKK